MEGRASLTAQGIAVMRAVESARPAGERLFDDPYARLFTSPWLAALTGFFTRTGYAEWRGPGVQGYLLARTRYIDDYLLECLAAGITQLVILGAGYDARAYRFADRLAGQVRVFEVDHPATQAVKLARLHKIFGVPPSHVTYVSIDFECERLDEGLARAGYAATAKTLFIWEGVTMYLTREAVDATLAFVAGHAGPGSRIVFDYVDRAVIEGRVKRGEAAGMRRYRRFTGEGLVFGIPAGTLERFLTEHGFTEVHDATSVELERLYFSAGAHRALRVAPVYSIATATVAATRIIRPGSPTT